MITKDYNSLKLRCSFFSAYPICELFFIFMHAHLQFIFFFFLYMILSLQVDKSLCFDLITQLFVIVRNYIFPVKFIQAEKLCKIYLNRVQTVKSCGMEENGQLMFFYTCSVDKATKQIILLIKIINMGNNLQKIAHKSPFDPTCWQQIIPFTSNVERQEKNFVILTNKTNGQMMDRYLVQFYGQQQLKEYYEEIKKRLKLTYSVEIKGYQTPSYEQYCGNTNRVYVFTENIPFRLANIKKMSFVEAMSMINIAMRGFAELFKHKGSFRINENLLCFNRQGKMKVWVNSNISKNQPQDEGENYQEKSQRSMIMSILEIISRKIDSPKSIMNLIQFSKGLGLSLNSFPEAVQASSMYTNSLKINIMSNFNFIIKNETNQDRACLRTTLVKKERSPVSKIRIYNEVKSKLLNKPESDKPFSKNKQISTNNLTYVNRNIDESHFVQVLWKDNFKKQLSTKKPYSLPQQKSAYRSEHEQRKRTIADDLLSDVSYISVQKPNTSFPYRSRYFQDEQEWEAAQKVKNGIRYQTSSSTPRQYAETIRCKYSTVDNSVQIDPQIAIDLLKYL